MSGTLPSSPGFTAKHLRSVTAVLVSIAQSGVRQVRDFGTHRWEFTASYPPMKRRTFSPIYAFLMKQRGSYGSFQLTIPDMRIPMGVASGSPIVNGALQTGTTIATSSWTQNVTGILKAGDIIKFNSSSKVYMITDDVNSDGSGNATLSIEPPVIASPVNGESVIVTNVPFTVMLNGSVHAMPSDHRNLYSFELNVVEVL